ncbi:MULTISPECIES: SMP-30/gluconolactonase/LRE family protein [unclassified Sphingomonas]|jgi:xylono-1,5-lactonase|uniref:SMP-30/gluconolactonase/LRE family protein n=1 Tax=unclassified Sphingomonas TaxID=196159 RepID=UPI000E107F4B|nr:MULTISPECIES: SMP-30/gluconolactonase/LRE family protein [unclassified Sphingomonas]AXJ95575.1 SMP-30/gluconolactonase/LRE family protein [Sphingomonas sp. FARSPH]
MSEVRTVWNGQATLGEGPVWDAGRGCLWFVDIKGRHVHRLIEGQDAARWDAPAQIGWVLPAADGTLLAGLQTGLARFDPEDGSFTHLHDPEPALPGNRLNDATVGPDGTVWFGTMDDGESEATGRVHRFDGTGVTTTDIPAVTITNGPGISPDGATLYHVDTIGGIIHAVPVAPDGTTGTPREFVRIDPADGHPDGVSVDSAGNVWLALWGGWAARCYAPDGTLRTEVRLPAANITKVALGGADLMTAYATSARKGLSDADLAAQPEAGNVFAFRVDVPGQAQTLAKVG